MRFNVGMHRVDAQSAQAIGGGLKYRRHRIAKQSAAMQRAVANQKSPASA